jgi:hypothetical protein
MLYQRIKKKKLLATGMVIALSFSMFGCGQVSTVSEVENVSDRSKQYLGAIVRRNYGFLY